MTQAATPATTAANPAKADSKAAPPVYGVGPEPGVVAFVPFPPPMTGTRLAVAVGAGW